jgi:plastocyanin
MRKSLAAVVLVAVLAALAALPALAATPVLNGTVGPGFTIIMKKKPTKAGKYKLVIADKSSIHNFHLTGPGVNVKTSVGAVGTKSFTITLKKGKYIFVCDPHATTMKGSFTIK